MLASSKKWQVVALCRNWLAPLDAHKIGGLHSIRVADHLLLLKVYMHLDRRCKAWLVPKEIPSKSLTLEAPRAPRAGTKPEPFGFFVFWVWLRILAGTHLLSAYLLRLLVPRT